MDQTDLLRLQSKSMEYRWRAGQLLTQISTNASRTLMSSFVETVEYSHHDCTEASSRICQHCRTVYLPDNHEVKLQPKVRLTRSIQKSMKRQIRKKGALARKDKRNLKNYFESSASVNIKCKHCNKVSKIATRTREQINSTKKTNFQSPAQNFNKPSLPITPCSTPTLSKSQKAKRKRSSSQLMYLMKEQSRDSPTTAKLHDFLSSL
ncbi:UPF0711 protein C18orf21 homolog [Ciona intestinalis]